MCKMHGVGVLKRIKVFESMLKTKIYRFKQSQANFLHRLLLCELKSLISPVRTKFGKMQVILQSKFHVKI